MGTRNEEMEDSPESGEEELSGSESGEEELSGSESESGEDELSGSESVKEEHSGSESGEEELSGSESVKEEQSGSESSEEELSGSESVKEEHGGSESGEEELSGSESVEEELSGWADSMSKILKSTKPKNKKNLILSRAKKDYEVNKSERPTTRNDIEIDKNEESKSIGGEDTLHTKTENSKNEDDPLSFKQQRKLELRQRKLERAWENLNRLTAVQPDRELESDLVKIATKGVVQLFNAVAQQQKTIKSKLKASESSEFKKEKILSQSQDIFNTAMIKTKILGKEKNNKSDMKEVQIKLESSSEEDDEEEEELRPKTKQYKRKLETPETNIGPSKRPVWQALQDDFMLNAKLKDWDKDSDTD